MPTPTDARPPLRPADAVAALAAECLVIALLWFAMDAFQHLRLTPADFIETLALWEGGVVLAYAGARWSRLPRWLWPAAAVLVPGVALGWLNASLKHPLSLAEILYAMGLMAAGRALWRCWRVPAEMSRASEYARRWLVLAAAVWAVFPFFTDSSVGGVDARWYANMMKDLVEQSRAGFFPVFVGQSEWAFNGAVHPFRSAPLVLWIAGIWDFIGARSLSIYSVEHLAAITASVAAGLGLYYVLNTLAPARRWVAAFCAAIYVLCPGILAGLYCADMYMTFVAAACLPLVFAGNARLLSGGTEGGHLTLATGLALVWMSHPPTALLASLATAGLQVGAYGLRGGSVGGWLRALLVVGMLFAGLALYYFASMSELPPRPGASLKPDLVWLAGLVLTVVAVLGGLHRPGLPWLLAALAGIVTLAAVYSAWAVWAVYFVLFAFGLRAAITRLVRREEALWVVPLATVSALAAAAAAWPLAQARGWARETAAIATLDHYASSAGLFFAPLSRDVATIWDFQLGWSVWLLGASALIIGVVRRRSAVVFGCVFALLVVLVIKLPASSSFLVGCAPGAVAAITSLPLVHRMLPVTAACAVVGGFLALASIEKKGPRVVTLLLLAGAFVWSGYQANRFVQRGRATTLSYSLSMRSLRTENALLYRFAYDLLPIPTYFSNGKMDPRLETRFLSTDLKVRIGPEEIARAMERGGVRELQLETRVYEEQPEWLRIVPDFHLAPDEDLLFRFEFDPARHYDGYFIFQSKIGDYREYTLPESGMPGAFGSGEKASRVLSLWDSGGDGVHYEFSHLLRPGNTLSADIPYARVSVSHYDPRLAPIRLESLLPYRVALTAPESGYVETPRVFLPGYAARVDGRPAKVLESQQRLAMVPVPAGEHRVELRYVGSLRLWTGAGISAVCWGAVLLYLRRRARTSTA